MTIDTKFRCSIVVMILFYSSTIEIFDCGFLLTLIVFPVVRCALRCSYVMVRLCSSLHVLMAMAGHTLLLLKVARGAAESLMLFVGLTKQNKAID